MKTNEVNKYYRTTNAERVRRYSLRQNRIVFKKVFGNTAMDEKLSVNFKLAISALLKEVVDNEGFIQFFSKELKKELLSCRKTIEDDCENFEEELIKMLFFFFLNKKDEWNFLNKK